MGQCAAKSRSSYHGADDDIWRCQRCSAPHPATTGEHDDTQTRCTINAKRAGGSDSCSNPERNGGTDFCPADSAANRNDAQRNTDNPPREKAVAANSNAARPKNDCGADWPSLDTGS